MGKNILYSVILHTTIVLISIFNISSWSMFDRPIINEQAAVIEIADPTLLQISDSTNLQKRIERTEIKKTEILQDRPKVSPQKVIKPLQGTEVQKTLPPEIHLEQRSDSTVLKLKTPTVVKSSNFDTLLKNLETTKQLNQENQKDKAAPRKDSSDTTKKSFEKAISDLVNTHSMQYSQALPLSLSEIDAIRSQIERCWNIPSSALDIENFVIEIRVQFTPDGQVLSAQTVEDPRYYSNRFYRAAVDSAKRAVYQCSPIKAPPVKYDRWRDIKLRFSPKEMLGL